MCLALQQWEEEARAEGTAQGIAAMNELIYVMVKRRKGGRAATFFQGF